MQFSTTIISAALLATSVLANTVSLEPRLAKECKIPGPYDGQAKLGDISDVLQAMGAKEHWNDKVTVPGNNKNGRQCANVGCKSNSIIVACNDGDAPFDIGMGDISTVGYKVTSSCSTEGSMVSGNSYTGGIQYGDKAKSGGKQWAVIVSAGKCNNFQLKL